MKKVLSIVLVVVMFLLCVPLTASAENTQSFSFELSVDGSDTKEVQTGDVITVLLRLKRTDSAEAYMMYAMQDEILYAVHQLHPKFMLVADEEAISLMKELL